MGQLQPILVRPKPDDDGGGYLLVAGHHRYQAAKQLGHQTIRAEIRDGLDADAALLAEIDENLVRADLSPAERKLHLLVQKEVYEKLHPETKQGATGRKGRQNGNLLRFTKVAAERINCSERSAQRDLFHARNVAVLREIAGTKLDRELEIEALAALPEAEQRKLAKQAMGGEDVSAQQASPRYEPDPDKGEEYVHNSEWEQLRLIELVLLGWSWKEIGAELGLSAAEAERLKDLSLIRIQNRLGEIRRGFKDEAS